MASVIRPCYRRLPRNRKGTRVFHLLLAACLTDAPTICAERLLPAADAPERADCERKAAPIARDWLARHPGLKGGIARCVESADLPDLPVSEIADGVHVHQGAVGQATPGNRGRIANLGFVIGDSVAVIDAGGSRAEGEALYAAIRKLTDRPISHLVLTHMHPDHILGAEVFAEAGATIIASASPPEAIARRSEGWMFSVPDQIGQQAFLGTRIAPVDQRIDTPVEISLGSTSLTAMPQPSAHSDTDLLVCDSDSGVVFAGDLVFRGLTPALDGSLQGWLDWMETRPDDADTGPIVPGHGPLAATWDEALAPGRQYLQALHDSTHKAIAGGMSLPQAIPVIVAMMRPWSEGWADFSTTTARNAASAYAQAAKE